MMALVIMVIDNYYYDGFVMMALVIMVIDNYYYDGFSDHHCERQLSL